MALAQDLIGIGDMPEQALRLGDVIRTLSSFGGSTIAAATLIGGPTGATILECSPATAGSSVAFMASTELDREYTIYNVNGTNALNVFPPNSTSTSFNGLTAGASFSLPANKSASVTRIGLVIGSTGTAIGVGATVASGADRWIYLVSA